MHVTKGDKDRNEEACQRKELFNESIIETFPGKIAHRSYYKQVQQVHYVLSFIQESSSFTTLLIRAPSACPFRRAIMAPITFPISTMELAPVSRIVLRASLLISSSLIISGKYFSIIPSSIFSLSARSCRPPSSHSQMASFLCVAAFIRASVT